MMFQDSAGPIYLNYESPQYRARTIPSYARILPMAFCGLLVFVALAWISVAI